MESIKIPLDPVSKKQKNFAFVRFRHEESVVYAIEVFRDVRLFGKNLRMQVAAFGPQANECVSVLA